MRVLILCTGNSCRSQMAHGFLQALNSDFEVHSAGTQPAGRVNPKAIEVMSEVGIDISHHQPKSVGIYLNDDPSEATGTDEFVMNEFRRVRDQIQEKFEFLQFVWFAFHGWPAAGHIAGILTIDGKPGKTPDQSWGVPAYIAGKNAVKVAKPYISMNKGEKVLDDVVERYVNAQEELLAVVVDKSVGASLAEIFDRAWDEVFSMNFRFNNYNHTHYDGADYGEFGPYELEPYTIYERLGLIR